MVRLSNLAAIGIHVIKAMSANADGDFSVGVLTDILTEVLLSLDES